MASDYIPGPDGSFDAWQVNFTSYVSANTAALGLLPADVTPLTDAQTAWTPAYSGHMTAAAAAASARQAKDDERAVFEGAIRPLVKRLQASATVTDAQRLAMGITVRDASPTPVGPPTTRPVANIDTSERLRHTVHFTDEASPTSKAKPAGVMGCEVWVKVGEPPSVPSELTFLALDTRTPYVADYASTDAGQSAHYMLRWVNSRGEKGPWSQTVSATIGA
jgi:hypothetical protein